MPQKIVLKRLIPAKLSVGLALVSVLAGVCLAAPSAAADKEGRRPPTTPNAQAYLHYGLGRLMESDGLLSDALVQYRRAEALDPGHCGLAKAVARTLLSLGKLEDAVEKSDRALEMCPDDVDVLSVHAEILFRSGDYERAEEVLAPHSGGAEAPRQLAVLYARALLAQGLLVEGNEFLLARTAVDSLDPDVAQMRGRVLLMLDSPDEAVAEFKRSVRLDPENRPVRGMLARLLIAMERPEEAVPMLERIVALYRPLEPEYVSLAAGYSMLGDFEAASSVLDEAVAVFGESAAILRARGAAHHSAGESDAAVNAYERLLELEPQSVTALNFVAYTLADENRSLEHALDYAQKAVALEPNNPLLRDTLGWAHYRLGRLDDARRELEAAVELGGDNAVILEHLGDVLDALGEEDEAADAWKRALRLEPGRRSTLERLGVASDGQDEQTLEAGSFETDPQEPNGESE